MNVGMLMPALGSSVPAPTVTIMNGGEADYGREGAAGHRKRLESGPVMVQTTKEDI
jgi:hypothetical protein